MTQKELNELLGDMSLEEKIGQLVQVPGSCYEESAVITGGMNNGWREETCRLAGSTLGIYGAKKLKKIQDRKSTRLNSSHRSQSRMPSSA